MSKKKVTSKKSYNFILVLSGVTDKTERLEDILFEAGCGDSLICFKHSLVYLEFDRASDSLDLAISSAIKDIESVKALDIKVSRVEPDPFVSLSEIAKRINTDRQRIDNYIKGAREDGSFPKPKFKISDRSPLYDWEEVTTWLFTYKKIQDRELVTSASVIKKINKDLEMRACR